MAYKTEDLHELSVKAIEAHKLFFIEDVVSYLPCTKGTFYEHNLHESDAIKAALQKNKTEVKVSLRSKWYKSTAPALQMALMKLVCTDDERKKLSMSYSDVTTQGEKINAPDLSHLTFEQLKELANGPSSDTKTD
jgi:hypothetical protein